MERPAAAAGDARFAKYVDHPELAGLLPVLYPGVFPNLAAYTKARADLDAILLTGIPAGVVPGFQNFTGAVAGGHAAAQRGDPADRRRENPLGLVAGDAAGFPNGRRLGDDVVTIELRAVAGLTIPLVDPSFTPDGAASAVADGTTNTNAGDHRDLPVPRAPRRRLPDGARHHGGVVSAEHDHGTRREPARRPGLGPARHRRRRRCPRGDHAGVDGRRGGRGADRTGARQATTARTSPSCRGRPTAPGAVTGLPASWSRAATPWCRREPTTSGSTSMSAGERSPRPSGRGDLGGALVCGGWPTAPPQTGLSSAPYDAALAAAGRPGPSPSSSRRT